MRFNTSLDEVVKEIDTENSFNQAKQTGHDIEYPRNIYKMQWAVGYDVRLHPDDYNIIKPKNLLDFLPFPDVTRLPRHIIGEGSNNVLGRCFLGTTYVQAADDTYGHKDEIPLHEAYHYLIPQANHELIRELVRQKIPDCYYH